MGRHLRHRRLGHIAVQYAVAMGMRVVAVDVADDKLALAKKHGAEITVNAFAEDPAEVIQEKIGGSTACSSPPSTRQRSGRRSA